MKTMKQGLKSIASRTAAVLCIAGALLSTATGAVALNGGGTAASPYLITNLANLVTFRDWVNAGNDCAGEFYQLTADIDMGGVAWTPIGSTANPFSGVFDGVNERDSKPAMGNFYRLVFGPAANVELVGDEFVSFDCEAEVLADDTKSATESPFYFFEIGGLA